ncbi:hypothetical protein GobsT_11740 [Gemmata obscuriglobus]|uniref:Uncharacterized protein n=1 Tax=Gemmata obscuriglobus TaxID=114 RepID=A0A2Z3H9Y8_9BACT|nr:hypothetical protein [Gemmata obscuriglobus]AWM40347.1 hypothetical protein C1280_27320 [Gemmata obscuriglobus]QEG26435.1 hypothetical protein GobsT_11740 [Gemmata obscuriglobus]VTS01593.1 unnamed protein product [Gemmata obscuriglobus UQM 2246]
MGSTYETELRQIFFAARGLMRRHGRERLRESLNLDGVRITLGARAEAADPDASTADLPPELGAKPSPALRRAFRVLRRLREERGPEAVIRAGEVAERWARDYPNKPPKKDTVKQALRQLRQRHVAYSSDARGWVFGRQQGTLFPAPEPEPAPPPPARPKPRPPARTVWVPGELEGEAVVVTDARTEQTCEVPGGPGARLEVASRSGRVRAVPAVRGELLGRDGPLALVKLPTGEKVYTRVLGDWHLDGRLGPEADADAG